MREVLEKLLKGEISLSEAERLLRINAVEEIESTARLDFRREFRAGIPEIVLAEGKSPSDTVKIVLKILELKGRVIVTRASEKHINTLKGAVLNQYKLRVNERAKLVVAWRKGLKVQKLGRKIGIMTGGTSDISVAEEAKAIAEEMGCEVITAYDVGIAGFHRHLEPLKRMIKEDVDALIVVAGMEGALPSVISSLVDIPVIGVPTSCGYGLGGKGVGALITMLQTCSPGLCVVNIDNGAGAGALAALIAHKVSKALKESEEIKRDNRDTLL
jgi:hypothetical protein